MSGPTGLDLASLPEVWRRMRILRDERDDIFQDLLLMQDAALAAMHED